MEDQEIEEKEQSEPNPVTYNQDKWKNKKKNPVFEVQEEKGIDGEDPLVDHMEIGTPIKNKGGHEERRKEDEGGEQIVEMAIGTPLKQPGKATPEQSKEEGSKTNNTKEKPPDINKKKSPMKLVKSSNKNSIKGGFQCHEINEARGYSGGIWAAWNQEIDAKCAKSHEQFIHLEFANPNQPIWSIIAVYASPQQQIRDNVWPEIENICTNYSSPILVAGDFNEIAAISEQKGGSQPNVQRCNLFKDWMDRCNLIDIFPAGPFYTWEGPKRPNQEKLFKRLDRVLCSPSWRTMFQDATVKNIVKIHSDHHPMLVEIDEEREHDGERPFRFEACWMQHDDFKQFLKDNWNINAELKCMLNDLTEKLKKWNKETFGDIKRRKNTLLKRMKGIQCAQERRYNPFLNKLGKKLAVELEKVLNQEEALWFQKARCQWIKDGDRNTRYYHTKAINRRKRNKIIMLRNNEGAWTENLEEIKAIIVNFFKELFSDDTQTISETDFNYRWPYIRKEEWESISHAFTKDEIVAADNKRWKGIRMGKDGMHLTHLMFADDLLLFGEATTEQANCVINCFKQAQEVGKYLGANLIHGRHTKMKYSHIIEKIKSRLAGWKANCLSLAGRATLTKSVLSTIPYYFMQHSSIPKGVTNEIEKLNRNFLWGSTNEKRKQHQVSWPKVCLPRKIGGLGIRSLEAMNKAFHHKLLWQLLCNNNLWVTVVSHKYKASHEPHFSPNYKDSDSRLWKNLCKLWPSFYSNVRWDLGNGNRVLFWKDHWIPEITNLNQENMDPSGRRNTEATVKDFINNQGQWDIEKLSEILPTSLITKVVEIIPPNPNLGPDHAYWDDGKEGNFSISSAYNKIMGIGEEPELHWSTLWKSNMQERNKMLIWRFMHDRLPTKSKLASWSSINPMCLWCQSARESNSHALRDCPRISQVWKAFINPRDRALFFNLPAKEWITWNLRKKESFCSVPWPFIFSTVCGMCWHWRNLKQKDQEFEFPNGAHRAILNQAKIHAQAMFTYEATSRSHKKLNESWTRPQGEWVKLNVDGAVCRITDDAGCGGLLRNSKGDWIKGFTCNLGKTTIICAELWGIYLGLKMVWNLGHRKVIVESDSSNAIDEIRSSHKEVSNQLPMMGNIMNLLNQNWDVRLQHISRSSNNCADVLAKKSISIRNGFCTYDSPPCYLLPAFQVDMTGHIHLDPGG
ncbi:ribonuclease H [Senna tora]|uniref:Ribonuclease H n=1 Tax=Senna tora TaxID=362788 RepID=A0A834XF56_9FABA|nr:ribonuclease H [Senna tora]